MWDLSDKNIQSPRLKKMVEATSFEEYPHSQISKGNYKESNLNFY